MQIQPPFKAGGPLYSDDSSYIERAAADGSTVEGYVTNLLMAVNPPLISLIEPRQQGKTSLVLKLKDMLPGYAVIYIDASTIAAAKSDDWYAQIAELVHASLEGYGTGTAGAIPDPAAGSRHWASFLNKLAMKGTQKTVVVLDEVGAIRFEGSDHFFSCIRSLTTIAARKLNFVLSGSFFTSELVGNPYLSPFNVATNVRLPDFTQAKVEELLCRKLPEQPDWRGAGSLAKRVYEWTGGQPYLTQLICGSLRRPDATTDDVDEAAHACVRGEDRNHFGGIRHHLRKEPDLESYLRDLIAGKKQKMVFNDPADVRSKLWLLGLVKEKDGLCAVRNRIYEEAFSRFRHSYDAFISYRHEGPPDYLSDWVFEFLRRANKTVFLDEESLQAGRFGPHILNAIEAAPNFVLVLSQGCLDHCDEPGDWYAQEIIRAIDTGRKIFMLEAEGFEHPSPELIRKLPSKIATLVSEEHRYRLGANKTEILNKVLQQFRPI